jgi:hypothetical protein
MKKSAPPYQETALFTTDDAILPAKPAASKIPGFVIEQLPTPLREPATVVHLSISFDARRPIPADVAAQVLSAINRARHRALTADCMTPATRAFWGSAHASE